MKHPVNSILGNDVKPREGKAINIIKTFAAQMEWKMFKPKKKKKEHIHMSNILRWHSLSHH